MECCGSVGVLRVRGGNLGWPLSRRVKPLRTMKRVHALRPNGQLGTTLPPRIVQRPDGVRVDVFDDERERFRLPLMH